MFGVVHVESEIKTTTEWICSHICNSLIIVVPVCFGLALFKQSLIKFRSPLALNGEGETFWL